MSFCTCPKTKIILRLAGETLDTPARDDWVPLVLTPAALSSRHARALIPPTPSLLVPSADTWERCYRCVVQALLCRPWPTLPAKTNTMRVAGSGTTFSDRLRTQKTKACLMRLVLAFNYKAEGIYNSTFGNTRYTRYRI